MQPMALFKSALPASEVDIRADNSLDREDAVTSVMSVNCKFLPISSIKAWMRDYMLCVRLVHVVDFEYNSAMYGPSTSNCVLQPRLMRRSWYFVRDRHMQIAIMQCSSLGNEIAQVGRAFMLHNVRFFRRIPGRNVNVDDQPWVFILVGDNSSDLDTAERFEGNSNLNMHALDSDGDLAPWREKTSVMTF